MPELERLVHEHPLRERFRAQLMLALYRSGRQAEALEVFQAGRRALVDELGIEPSPILQELERQILNQDPALAAPVRPPTARPPETADHAARHGRRRPVILIALGALILAGAAAAAWQLTGSGSDPIGSIAGNAVAAIDPSSNEIVAEIPVGKTPGDVAVGEGAVWVVNQDARTISRIEPETKAVETFAVGATPLRIAAGEGGLWIGTGAEGTFDRVVRLDPATLVTQATIELPATGETVFRNANAGYAADQMTVALGYVWVVTPDAGLARIDPGTNQLDSIRLPARVFAVASDGRTVWALGYGRDLLRVNPSTGAVTARIVVPSSTLVSIAVGGSFVWAGDDTGLVWRIAPPREAALEARFGTIELGRGLSSLAFGEGALWVGRAEGSTVVRIDPASAAVAAGVQLGNPTSAIAAGQGAVWAAAVGSAREGGRQEAVGAIDSPACGPLVYDGEGSPDAIIAADLFLQGGYVPDPAPMAGAIELAVRERGFRAGPFRVGLQVCDSSTPEGGTPPAKCAANASSYAATSAVIGVIGPLTSGCTVVSLPILNRAAGGPVPMISPTNSRPGLTHAGAASEPDEPERYYPTGIRSFVRLYPSDDDEWAAEAALAKDLGARSVYIVTDDVEFPEIRWPARVFTRAATRLGLTVAGRAKRSVESDADDEQLAGRVRDSGADAVYVSGGGELLGPFLARLREVLGPSVPIILSQFALPIPLLVETGGEAVRGVYLGYPGAPNDELGTGWPAFEAAFEEAEPGVPITSYGVAYAAQATELLLDAIARSDGTRSSVVDALFEARVTGGILGDFAVEPDGDSSLHPVTIFRVEPGAADVTGIPDLFGDAVVDRVLTPPSELLR